MPYAARNPSSGASRASSAAAAALAVGAIGWGLVNGLSFLPSTQDVREALTTLSIQPAPTPPPTPSPTPSPPPPAPEKAPAKLDNAPAPKDEEGRRNLRNQAPQIVAPVLPPLIKPPVVAAPKAGAGSAQNTGASDRMGPGEGAGNRGNGLGGGGTGGSGNGGGAAEVGPELLRGRLKFKDLDRNLRRDRIGGEVTVRFRVETDGRVGTCQVLRSSGDPRVDATPCPLIRERYRFEPARDVRGRPVAAWVEENHGWFYPRED
jgi:periplasmic protein TonB